MLQALLHGKDEKILPVDPDMSAEDRELMIAQLAMVMVTYIIANAADFDVDQAHVGARKMYTDTLKNLTRICADHHKSKLQ